MTHATVLVFEEDELTGKTLSTMLEAEGYDVTWTSKIDQALSLIKNKRFDIGIVSVDAQGKSLNLLQRLRDISSEVITIAMTAYPSGFTAEQLFNIGAHAYFVKPIEPEDLLRTIKNKLELKTDPKRIVEGQFDFPSRGVLSSKEFQKYLDSLTEELAPFGLTKNQAKAYVSIVASTHATASDVAVASGIRREEVYRILPELAEMGIVTKQIGNPLKFSAVSPENALDMLIKTKLSKTAKELNSLIEKKTELVTKLRTNETLLGESSVFIESILNTEKLYARYREMHEKVKKTVDAVVPIQFLQFTHINIAYILKKFQAEGVTTRIITENDSLNTDSGWFARATKDPPFLILVEKGILNLKYLQKLPFNLIIADSKEVLWGEFHIKKGEENCYWSNQPYQIEIAKSAFDSLWKKAALFQ